MSAVAHIDQYKQGRFYTDAFRGEMSWNGYERNTLLRNMGPDEEGLPQFVDMAAALGADDVNDARGVALLDYDNDGDLDLAINHNPGDNGRETEGVPATLLRNDIGGGNRWIAITLEGVRANRDAVGAIVSIEAGGVVQKRLVSAGSSYASQQTRRLYFGLGQAQRVETLTVRWPGGGEERHHGLEAGRWHHLVEGGGLQVRRLPRLIRQAGAMP